MVDPTNSSVPLDKKFLHKGSLQVDYWLVAVLACYTLFAWANWGKAQYLFWDIGREAEIPTRILAGQLLYRDVETFYGPLAYYANALALLLFDHHLEVFYTVDLSLTLAATLLFYRLAKRLMNAPWATLCTVYMLIYCALGPGLFNFILPYSSGAVYAMVLCLLAITTLDCYGCTGRLKWLVAAAIACGLAGLAKQEYGVAALGSVLVGTNLYFPQNLRSRVEHSIIVLLVALICVFLPFALLAQQVSWETIHLSLFPIHRLAVLNRNTFFQVSPAKTLHIWWHTFKDFLFGSLVVLASVIAAQWFSKFRWFRSSKWLKSLFEIVASVVLVRIGFSLLSRIFHWNTSPIENLSWFIPVSVGWFALNLRQLIRNKDAPLLWTLLVFSLLLNVRWLLYINFYGLYAPPVALLFFIVLYNLTQANRIIWNSLLVCMLIFSGQKLSELAQYRYAIQSSYGTLYTANAKMARAFNQTINVINTSKAKSVLVLPEGSILTFMTGTYSPSRIITFQPIALPDEKAQQDFVSSMKKKPPELIVYLDMPFREVGYRNYAEFNPIVDRWITQEHKLISVVPEDEGVIRIYAREFR